MKEPSKEAQVLCACVWECMRARGGIVSNKKKELWQGFVLEGMCYDDVPSAALWFMKEERLFVHILYEWVSVCSYQGSCPNIFCLFFAQRNFMPTGRRMVGGGMHKLLLLCGEYL